MTRVCAYCNTPLTVPETEHECEPAARSENERRRLAETAPPFGTCYICETRPATAPDEMCAECAASWDRYEQETAAEDAAAQQEAEQETATRPDPEALNFTLTYKLAALKALIRDRKVAPLDALTLAAHYETQAVTGLHPEDAVIIGKWARECVDAAAAQLWEKPGTVAPMAAPID